MSVITVILETIAQWAWGSSLSEDVSPQICLDSLPFLSMPCFNGLLIKGIGIGIILGACFNKAPLIMNILNSKSVAGMSTGGLYAEIVMYANSAFYSILRKNPFTAYGETAVVTVQAMGVCTLLWKYKDDPPIPTQQRFMVTAAFVVYVFLVFTMLQPEYYYLLMTLNWPALIYSRGSQILMFKRVQHTGTQSLITNGTNLLGSCIRILTTIKEVGMDMTMLGGYVVSVFLNVILVSQFFLYKENTKKYLESLEDKKKD
jgi:mannose-P-dolichol utilization defect protein 1